jgi:hypothetical protein
VLESLQPLGLSLARQLRLGALCERQVVLRMAAAQLICHATLLESCDRVLPDRLEHQEALVAVAEQVLLD